MELKYKRIVIKVSGEALAGADENIDFDIVNKVAAEIKTVHDMGADVCLVVGGGNIWRGRKGKHMNRITADHMGMLATVINALALQDALEQMEVPTRVLTAIEMRAVAEPFIYRRAVRHLEKRRVVIFACGTGNPYYTTDMAAALRAAEMQAELIMMAKNIDGVYDSDPRLNPNAVRYDRISHLDIIKQELNVIDASAATLCHENGIPICIFALADENSIVRAVTGEKLGTMISD